MTRLAVFPLAFIFLGCAMTPDPARVGQSSPREMVATTMPGIVVCMNANLQEQAKRFHPEPNVVIVVVYGDSIYGQQYVLPDVMRGRLPVEDFARVMKALHPGRTVLLAVFDMPVLAKGDQRWLYGTTLSHAPATHRRSASAMTMI